MDLEFIHRRWVVVYSVIYYNLYPPTSFPFGTIIFLSRVIPLCYLRGRYIYLSVPQEEKGQREENVCFFLLTYHQLPIRVLRCFTIKRMLSIPTTLLFLGNYRSAIVNTMQVSRGFHEV